MTFGSNDKDERADAFNHLCPCGIYGCSRLMENSVHIMNNKIHEFLATIRKLKTPFKILKNTTEEMVFAVENAELGDRSCAATLRFVLSTHIWANQWDEINQQWRDVPGFSVPELGQINEAYIKPVGDRFKLSFSDMSTPLIRWGFTAKDMQIFSDA